MRLLFLYGLPGVGKSTFATRIAQKVGYALFTHLLVLDLIISVFGMDREAIFRLREKLWLDVIEQAGKRQLEGIIFTFVFDKYLSDDFVKRLEEKVAPYGTISYVKLTCSMEEIKKRIRDPQRAKGANKLTSFTSLQEQVADKSFFVPELQREVFEINTSQLTIDETVTKIISHYF